MTDTYEYNGMIYCDRDLSTTINNYGGNLRKLHYELLKNNKVEEFNGYYLKCVFCDGEYFENYKELIKEKCEKLGIKEIKAYE